MAALPAPSNPTISTVPDPAPLSDEGEADLAKVRRVNQSWIVRGQLKETATAWIDHLRLTDPTRLEKSCWLALFLTRCRKNVLRDPKQLLYASLFAFATRTEIGTFLEHNPSAPICLLQDPGVREDPGAVLNGTGLSHFSVA